MSQEMIASTGVDTPSERPQVPEARWRSSRLTAWMSVAANLAVLVGMILVAVQISQNTDAVRGASYQTWLAARMELNLALATNQELSTLVVTGHADSRNLTQDNYVQYGMWLASLMQMAQATHYLYRQGSLDRDLWETEIQAAAAHLSTPGVRQWWDAGAKTQLTPDFVAVVESTDVVIHPWGWTRNTGFKRGF